MNIIRSKLVTRS